MATLCEMQLFSYFSEATSRQKFTTAMPKYPGEDACLKYKTLIQMQLAVVTNTLQSEH